MALKIAKIDLNDVVNGKGICVSLWTQGCPHRCHGCHNPSTWDFNGGTEMPLVKVIETISDGIQYHGMKRNFSILGGEPLCEQNRDDINVIVQTIRDSYPNIKIFLWTGYTLKELQCMNNESINNILNNIDVLIDGRYVEEERDITLDLRGSKNQNIIQMK